ncbi:MAG: hypothetical protein JW732_06525 [Dehalococcoidia bacterium]|nr:hypothetical protein [Dehalococcoidia bacterium]
MLAKGNFYNTLIETRGDSGALQEKMEETVQKFLENETDMNKPGMLLGKIQGGKTRAFIGIIALAFDNGYDMAIILTKGTKALARQTHARLKKDFHDFIDDDMIKLYDILNIPDRLPGYILRQKLIMIVKKETNNLERIIRMIVQRYPDLSDRKVLIIDDEADFASIGFARRREGSIELRRIASQIDELRRKVRKSDFLEVTATPYSLYLQPEDTTIPTRGGQFIFEPVRPAFTVLLPVYETYIGGDFFFGESSEEDSIAHYVYEEVPLEELDALRREDGRVFKIEDCLTHRRVQVLRRGIVNFIVGACVRRIQQGKSQRRREKYSFVVHTEQARGAHEWQVEVVARMNELLMYYANHNLAMLSELVRESYDDLSKSISIIDTPPEYEEVFQEVLTALKEDSLMIRKVNSDSAVEELLDDNGELELSAPLNVFIGGQILDRGVTIRNFIGFYYGRRPRRFQQDTVLQHSRIYGNRPREDLAVTRFYTALGIYSTLQRINEFDNALREAFERGAHAGVVFIRKDSSNRILPCSPNKISISSTTTLRAGMRMLPIGFQTDYIKNIRDIIKELDIIILGQMPDVGKPFLIEFATAESIIDMIAETLVMELDWDWEAFKSCIEFLSKNTENEERRGKIWCLVRTERNLSRIRPGDGRFSDNPDTGSTDTNPAREIAVDVPALILIRQNGSAGIGWRDHPFWWPVLIPPQRTATMIFASQTADVD